MMDAYKPSTAPSSKPAASSRTAAAPKKGMSLSSKSSKNQSLEDALVLEDKLAPLVSASSKAAPVAAAAESVPQAIQHPIMLVISEKVSARMTRDGQVESNEVKGSLTLTASSEEAGLCSVQMKTARNADKFTFTTHPKVNKGMYEKSGLLQLKDVKKGFPSARPVGILKWSYSSASEDLIPLKINCWPEEESRGQMNVSIEYELEQTDLTLHDVCIRIPLGTTDSVNILNMDGSYKHNSSQGELEWQLPLVDESNASGSLEFTIAQKDTDAFFPITVDFTSQQLFCGIEVVKVAAADGASPIQYGLTQVMSSDEYTIE
jgi:coatomer subunit delta